MFSLPLQKGSSRPGSTRAGRTARKASRGRPRRRCLRHEPLEERMLLSGGTTDLLLHTFTPDPSDSGVFGNSVAGLGNKVLVGNPSYGAEADPSGAGSPGAVFLFDGTTGDLLHTFANPAWERGENDNFGTSVAVVDDNVLIGDTGADAEDGVSSAGAVYLYQPDPTDPSGWKLAQTFWSPTPDEDDIFGSRVAAAGDYVLIAAGWDDTAGENAGAAHLFSRTTGQLLHTFVNPEPEDGGMFGRRVAVVGDYVLIGDNYDDNNGVENAGAAHLYSATTGELLKTFVDPQPTASGYFGVSVAAVGDNVVIGAPSYNSQLEAGVAYLFEADPNDPSGQTWNCTQTFENPTPEAGNSFGHRIAAVGNDVLIGAYCDDTGITDAGAAYLFDGTTGELLRAYLNPSPTYRDRFGTSVAAVGNNLAMGAPGDHSPGSEDRGAIHLFVGFDAQRGDIAGQVFADLNGDAIDNDGAALPEGFTVFLDLNLDGARDTEEPVATTIGREGNYAFYGLAPGDYSVALEAQSGWTPTTSPQTVTVTAGDLVGNVDFGNYVPTAKTVYGYDGPERIRDRTWLGSEIAVEDSLEILDLDVQVDVTHSTLSDLMVMYLRNPQDTRVDLLPYRWYHDAGLLEGVDLRGPIFDDEAAMSILDGTAPYDGSTDASGGRYLPVERLNDFDLEDVQGSWHLWVGDGVKNRETGTLNSWSLIVTHAVTPPEPGITVEPTSGLVTSEKGQSATFEVVLNTQPTAPVTIDVTSNDTPEGVLDGADANGILTLTFDQNNWDQPQTVTIIGVDDSIRDGDVPYSIVLASAVSADPDYAGLDPADVSLTNEDNDKGKPPKSKSLSADALLAADGLFGANGSGVDLLAMLVDDRLFPASPKRHGKRSAVDLALEEITAGPFDEQLVEDLALASV